MKETQGQNTDTHAYTHSHARTRAYLPKLSRRVVPSYIYLARARPNKKKKEQKKKEKRKNKRIGRVGPPVVRLKLSRRADLRWPRQIRRKRALLSTQARGGIMPRAAAARRTLAEIFALGTLPRRNVFFMRSRNVFQSIYGLSL